MSDEERGPEKTAPSGRAARDASAQHFVDVAFVAAHFVADGRRILGAVAAVELTHADERRIAGLVPIDEHVGNVTAVADDDGRIGKKLRTPVEIGTDRAFRIDAEGHIEASVQKLLEDPITYLDAMLKSVDAEELNAGGKSLKSVCRIVAE